MQTILSQWVSFKNVKIWMKYVINMLLKEEYNDCLFSFYLI